MIITIHQPEHLPWLGLFNKIAKVEKFIILDNVQYEKNYFQSRNRIIGTNGIQWINIPVTGKGHMNGTIATTEISNVGGNKKWRKKYLRTIEQSYKKYPFYSEVYPIIEEAISMDTKYFCEINIALIKRFCEKLSIYPEYIRASELNVNGSKSTLILDICKTVQADTYIAGPSGRDYLNMNSFEKANIIVKFNDYIHPIYLQKGTRIFVDHLSAVDLFMNCGFKDSKRIIMEGNEEVSNF